MDWTAAGIPGAAAQRWPFTQLPFSSARVKRSAGAGEHMERGKESRRIQGRGKKSPEGQKAGARRGRDEGVARSCVKSARCSFKISHFLCRLLCVPVRRRSALPRAPCSPPLFWNRRVQINQPDLNRNRRFVYRLPIVAELQLCSHSETKVSFFISSGFDFKVPPPISKDFDVTL